MKYRIWVQSSTVINESSAYLQGIKAHAKKILSPDVTIDIHGVPKGSTTDVHYMGYEFLNNRSIINNVLEAEKNHYDAFASHCFLDPVLDESRELVDIPVVSLGEASMLYSLMYGRKFAVVTYTPQLANKSYPNLINKYQLNERSVPVQSFEITLPELQASFSNPEPVLEKYLDACERAIDKGAEVILPGCGLLNILCVQNGISKVRNTGATIIDVTGVLLKTAETAIKLKEVSNTTISRSGYYEKPDNIEVVKKSYDNLSIPIS
jgi:allantoin racemase